MLTQKQIKQSKNFRLIVILAILAIFNLWSFNSWIAAVGGWVTAALTIYFWHQTRYWPGFLAIYVVSWITVSIAWLGATPMFGLAHYIFMAGNVLMAMIPFALERWLVFRTGLVGERPFISTLIFPAAATAVEYLSVFGSPLGSFGAAGYAQAVFPVISQLISVTGLLGITFVTTWFASTAVWAWEQRTGPVRRGLAIYAVLLAAVLIFGSARLWGNQAETVADEVQIAAFTAAEWEGETLFPLLNSDRERFRSETQLIHAAYLAQTAAAADDGAELVLWPEGAILGVPEDVQETVAQAQTLARERGIYLGVPTFEFFPDSDQLPENRLLIIDPQGEVVINHVKYGGNFIEGTLLGDGQLQTVETPFGTLSGVICWDADFPAVIRQAGQAGVDVLLVPSRDWEEITPLHGEMATYRGIENGLTVIRQADHGLSLISDPYGRVLSEANHFNPDGRAIEATIAIRSTNTIYAQTGDWLGLLAVAGVVVLTGWALLRGRRQAAQPVGELAPHG
ncbi:MAG: nitrilase-related carbon-nitrogen hydrolase [Ardenticatenaceae bacterium]|nr:nitrilase-related carbon-nitrogen hydrolase [Ardenticatenaceae bacterium]